MTKKKQEQPTGIRPFLVELRDCDQPVGKFAVFGSVVSGAKFKIACDSYESAQGQADKYAASLASSGATDFAFYVVEIKSQRGIVKGRVVQS